MRKMFGALLVIMMLGCLAMAQAAMKQENKPAPSVADVLNRSLSGLEHELVPMIEQMPADKFDFAPTQGEFKGVRNFASQAKHVAAGNYLFGSYILGEKPPAEAGGGENGPADVKSKEQIVKFLKDSFVYLHKAFSSINEKNQTEWIKSPFGGQTTRLGIAVLLVGHINDHYGQLVEYTRMNGLIPPASQPRKPAPKKEKKM